MQGPYLLCLSGLIWGMGLVTPAQGYIVMYDSGARAKRLENVEACYMYNVLFFADGDSATNIEMLSHVGKLSVGHGGEYF